MQWFLEFLGFREPPGAPVPPPPPRTNPLKPPKLNFFSSRTEKWLFVIYMVLWASASFASGQGKIDWFILGFIALAVSWFFYTTYTKRRWKALRENAKAAGYLHCPTCNHDLRGTRLKDSTDLVTIPLKAAQHDLVVCPECGEEHRVKDLGEIWELP